MLFGKKYWYTINIDKITRVFLSRIMSLFMIWTTLCTMWSLRQVYVQTFRLINCVLCKLSCFIQYIISALPVNRPVTHAKFSLSMRHFHANYTLKCFKRPGQHYFQTTNWINVLLIGGSFSAALLIWKLFICVAFKTRPVIPNFGWTILRIVHWNKSILHHVSLLQLLSDFSSRFCCYS